MGIGWSKAVAGISRGLPVLCMAVFLGCGKAKDTDAESSGEQARPLREILGTERSGPGKTPPVELKDHGGSGRTPAVELQGHERQVLALAFSRDGSTLASGSLDKTVLLWDVATGTEKKSIPHPAGHVYAVGWTAENRLVTTSGDGKSYGELNWWDPETGVCRKKVTVAKGAVRGLGLSADGQKLAWNKGAVLEVVSSELEDKGPPLASFNKRVFATTHIAFSQDGKQLLFTSPWGAQLWTMDSGAEPKGIDTPNDPSGVGFDPRGNCLISSERGVVFVVDSTTGNRIESMIGNVDMYGAVATPDGKYVASGASNGVRFFNPKTRQEVGRVTVPGGVEFIVNCIAVSPDGSLVAAGGGSTPRNPSKNYSVYIWNISSMVPPPKK
jgi:WD40 repeat protein